jgi:hypothetical protein
MQCKFRVDPPKQSFGDALLDFPVESLQLILILLSNVVLGQFCDSLAVVTVQAKFFIGS